MNRFFKRASIVIASIFILVSCTVPGTGFPYTENGLIYDKVGGVLTVVKDDSYAANLSGNIVISDTINGEAVTAIASDAFAYCSLITGITFPSGITTIGDKAFDHCEGLTTVDIPSSVTTMGNYVFLSCRNLTGVTLPDNMTTISTGSFAGCARLTNFTFPSGITTIGYNAFNGTGLTSITIPDSVITIGDDAFIWCEEITDVIIGDGVTTIGLGAFQKCILLENVTIGSGVTTIGENAFRECNTSGASGFTLNMYSPTAPTLGGPNVFTDIPNVTTVLNILSSGTTGYLSDPPWNDVSVFATVNQSL